MRSVGVLALQGDVREHVRMLKDLGTAPIEVRMPEPLEDVDALVIPGGESTTIGFMLAEHDMIDPLRKRIGDGMPVLGTCAGAILLADSVIGGATQDRWPTIGGLGVTIHRNAYGRQVDSFEDDLEIAELAGGPVHAVFIRAPWVERVGPDVQVLGEAAGHIVAVRQGQMLATAFHPEMTGDRRIHKLFVDML